MTDPIVILGVRNTFVFALQAEFMPPFLRLFDHEIGIDGMRDTDQQPQQQRLMNDRLVYVNNGATERSEQFRKGCCLPRPIFSGEMEKHQRVDCVLKRCVHTEYRSEETHVFEAFRESVRGL